MSQFTFDTLEYANTLEKAGFSKEQTQALAFAQKQAMNELVAARDLATKKDILLLRQDMIAFKADLIKWFLGTTLPLLAVMTAGFAFIISGMPR